MYGRGSPASSVCLLNKKHQGFQACGIKKETLPTNGKALLRVFAPVLRLHKHLRRHLEVTIAAVHVPLFLPPFSRRQCAFPRRTQGLGPVPLGMGLAQGRRGQGHRVASLRMMAVFQHTVARQGPVVQAKIPLLKLVEVNNALDVVSLLEVRAREEGTLEAFQDDGLELRGRQVEVVDGLLRWSASMGE